MLDDVFLAEKMTQIPIEQETINYLISGWKQIEEIFEQQNRKKKPKDQNLLGEIEAMRKGIKLAREEMIAQYETIQKRMGRVLKIIEENKIPIPPGTAPKDDFDRMMDALHYYSNTSEKTSDGT